MVNIEYIQLNSGNFGVNSLDNFVRHQEVEECWRRKHGKYVLTTVAYTEDWNLTELRKISNCILEAINGGCLAYGAVFKDEIVGFAFLEKELFGSCKQYANLAEFYVSKPFRNKGIGKKLFESACKGAKKLGADKLYISAHSAKESIAAYKKYGCVLAEEINDELAAKEPCDLQMEFKLI